VACFGRSFTSDFAWSAMMNPPSIGLINPIEMDLSSASNAANNAVDDGGITGVHPIIDSPPRIRPNPRPKRQLSQLTQDDDVDPNDGLYQSYQESPAAQRLVHSPECVPKSSSSNKSLNQMVKSTTNWRQVEKNNYFGNATINHRLC
jgi:hypothetical protein